jgi:hypothetical protein
MTESTHKPDGAEIHVEESGMVTVEFEGCDADPIRVNGHSAQRLGSMIKNAGEESVTQ